MSSTAWSEGLDLSHPPFLDRSSKSSPLSRREARKARKARLAAVIDAVPCDDQVPSPGARRFWIGCEVWKAATEYNSYRALAAKAPRKSTVAKELHRVERACRELANAIDAMSDPALELWRSAVVGPGGAVDPERKRLFDLAYGNGFPHHAGLGYHDIRMIRTDDPKSPFSPDIDHGYLAPRLRMTATIADWLQCEVGEDRGGGADYFKEKYGSATWQLTRLCWTIFDTYGGAPTSAEDGAFYQFAAAVHEFATGETSDSVRGLRDNVRKAVAIQEEYVRLQRKQEDSILRRGPGLTDAEGERLSTLSFAWLHGRLP